MTLTDAEKTRLLAEGVMGLTLVTNEFGGWWFDGELPKCRLRNWQPLTNEAHAAEVRERMRELGWETQLTYGTIKDWAGMNDCKGTQF